MLNSQVKEFRANTPELTQRPEVGTPPRLDSQVLVGAEIEQFLLPLKQHYAAVRRTELHNILQRPIRERLPLVVEHVSRFTDSYSRMAEVLTFKDRLTRTDWLHLLEEFWGVCDNVGDHRLKLKKILGTDDPLRAMMKP
jgi:hypothetical protein